MLALVKTMFTSSEVYKNIYYHEALRSNELFGWWGRQARVCPGLSLPQSENNTASLVTDVKSNL